MTSPVFLHELGHEIYQQLSLEEIEQIHIAEQLYWQNKPKKSYYIAVQGSKTKNGGIVQATFDSVLVQNLAIARVGDEVLYPDGSKAKIISGAGCAQMIDGVSTAIVGSLLDNNDEIIESPNTTCAIVIYADAVKPQNFLDHESF